MITVVDFQRVSPKFFEKIGTPMLAGRDFGRSRNGGIHARCVSMRPSPKSSSMA